MRQYLHVFIVTSICFFSACSDDQDQINEVSSDTDDLLEESVASTIGPEENREIDQQIALQEANERAKLKSEEKTPETTQPPPSPPPISEFKTIEWTDLMPKEDIEALENPPSYVTEVEDGSEEDKISGQLQNAISAATNDRYQQALVSTRVIQEMDGKAIRLPGFIVPLEFDEEQTITQFFLVPFFGACIHLPPPPPNQIILVDYPKGIQLEALYDPFWVSGVIKVELVENATATAAYTMRMYHFEPYTDLPSE